MKRVLMLLTAALVIVVILVLMAGPAFARHGGSHKGAGLCIAGQAQSGIHPPAGCAVEV